VFDVLASPPNNRQIYWVMDFNGNTGKSQFVRAVEKKGLTISADIDNPRAFAKQIIIEATEYFQKYGKHPPAIIIDLSRQVPEAYLNGFYGVLESLKNSRVRSMFGVSSKYERTKPPHVIVFVNMPLIQNSLSADRILLLEILPQQYEYKIRYASCLAVLDDYNGKFVKYHYQSSQEDDEKKLKLIKNSDSATSLVFAMLYEAQSESVIRLEHHVLGGVVALVMELCNEAPKQPKLEARIKKATRNLKMKLICPSQPNSYSNSNRK